MTVIAAGILENPFSIYNLKTFTFDKTHATELINKWRNSKHYSEVFRSIIANLVEFNPDDRLTLGELWGFISKYELNIKSKEKFLITSVPAKIEKEVNELRKFTKSSNVSK